MAGSIWFPRPVIRPGPHSIAAVVGALVLVALAVTACSAGTPSPTAPQTFVIPPSLALPTSSASATLLESEPLATASTTLTPVQVSFGQTGSMVVQRNTTTATLLLDGRVLLAGGYSEGPRGSAWTATAELYDPKSGSFSPTGPMATARDGATATRLADGHVLVAGGSTGTATLASAELYDPLAGAFTQTGSMAHVRVHATATQLGDGRILIAGGGASASETATAELYDPSSGKFSPTGSMANGRIGAIAISLSDGRALIVGGTGDTGLPLSSAEIYDPATGKFIATGSMAYGRRFFVAVRLLDDRVLVAGGDASMTPGHGVVLSAAELYDPRSGKFSPAGFMTVQRRDHAATQLGDGRVLITGGDNTSSSAGISAAEIYDPATGKFSPTSPSMAHPRYGHTATLLLDGRVLVAGGFGDVQAGSTAEVCQA
jgi:hypothetical protein